MTEESKGIAKSICNEILSVINKLKTGNVIIDAPIIV